MHHHSGRATDQPGDKPTGRQATHFGQMGDKSKNNWTTMEV